MLLKACGGCTEGAPAFEQPVSQCKQVETHVCQPRGAEPCSLQQGQGCSRAGRHKGSCTALRLGLWSCTGSEPRPVRLGKGGPSLRWSLVARWKPALSWGGGEGGGASVIGQPQPSAPWAVHWGASCLGAVVPWTAQAASLGSSARGWLGATSPVRAPASVSCSMAPAVTPWLAATAADAAACTALGTGMEATSSASTGGLRSRPLHSGTHQAEQVLCVPLFVCTALAAVPAQAPPPSAPAWAGPEWHPAHLVCLHRPARRAWAPGGCAAWAC